MPALTAQEIATTDDAYRQRCPVPEWCPPGRDPAHCYIWIAAISSADLDQWEAEVSRRKRRYEAGRLVAQLDPAKARGLRAELVRLAAVDDQGQRIFAADDVTWLASKSARALSRAYEMACRLAGLTDDQTAAEPPDDHDDDQEQPENPT